MSDELKLVAKHVAPVRDDEWAKALIAFVACNIPGREPFSDSQAAEWLSTFEADYRALDAAGGE